MQLERTVERGIAPWRRGVGAGACHHVAPTLSELAQTLTERDALDVSLHDVELREEVELTTRFIVAVNESGRALSIDEIDEILGIPLRQESAA